MPKRVDDTLTFMSKFISPLLIFLISMAFTIKSDLSDIQAVNEERNRWFDSHEAAYTKLVDKADLIVQKVSVLTARQTHVMNQLDEVEKSTTEIGNIQKERTDEIECIDSIRDVLGCNVPPNHP